MLEGLDQQFEELRKAEEWRNYLIEVYQNPHQHIFS